MDVLITRALLATLFAVLLAPGVGAADNGRNQGDPGRDGPPALHAVQNDRLLELMNRMNALLFERMPRNSRSTRSGAGRRPRLPQWPTTRSSPPT